MITSHLSDLRDLWLNSDAALRYQERELAIVKWSKNAAVVTKRATSPRDAKTRTVENPAQGAGAKLLPE